MDTQSGTYSIKLESDTEITIRKGYIREKVTLRRGMYRVPTDLDQQTASTLLREGKATKHVRKKSAPENKSASKR